MVAGCLSPDFEYFLWLAPHGGFGHTWLGVVVADLPLSLLALWLYQSYLKAGVYAVAPGLFPFREEELKTKPVARGLWEWAVTVASILLGATTHIVWDSFTHERFWPYAHIAFLRARVPLPFGRVTSVCNVLQYVSSAAGMAVLLVLWARWVEAMGRPGVPAVRRLGVVLAAAAFLVAILRVGAVAHLFGRLTLTAIGVVTFLTMLVLFVGLIGAWQRWMPE